VRFSTENWPYLRNGERYSLGYKLLLITDRKWHTGFYIKSLTLDDLESVRATVAKRCEIELRLLLIIDMNLHIGFQMT